MVVNLIFYVEDIIPLVSGEIGCNRFSEGTPAHLKDQAFYFPIAKPTR